MTSISKNDTVLAIADRLWQRRNSLSLDEVDGAFYWWACRRDDFPGPFSSLDNLSVEGLMALHGESPDWYRWAWFAQDDHFPLMRPTWVRILPGALLVGVANSAWRGDDVAKHVHRYDGENRGDAEYLEAIEEPDWPDDYAAIKIRSWLKQPGEFGFVEHPVLRSMHTRDGLPTLPRPSLAFPFVLLEVAFPLPPAQVLAAFYDAWVIDARQWHRALVGSVNGQTLEVAIRTWAVSLLMATGIQHGMAMSEVCNRLGLEYVSQPKYGRDRALLLRRVPEVEACLQGNNP